MQQNDRTLADDTVATDRVRTDELVERHRGRVHSDLAVAAAAAAA